MESTPIAGLDELDNHLNALLAEPSIPINAKLFDDVELQLNETTTPFILPRLFPKIASILPTITTQDPSHLATLATKLLRPLNFTQILSLASADLLIQALNSPAPSTNLLALSALHKSAASPSDAAILASMAELVAALVHTWLAAPQVEVGQKGGRVLGDVLETDCAVVRQATATATAAGGGTVGSRRELASRHRTPGQGKLWQRLLSDRDTFTLLIDLLTGRHASTSPIKQRSLAQGRFLRLLPRLCTLHFSALSQPTRYPILTPTHATNGHFASDPPLPSRHISILQFTYLDMVDRSDALMHMTLIASIEAFVSLMRVAECEEGEVEVVRKLLREAAGRDGELVSALQTLPDRTVEDEQDALRAWLRMVLPESARGVRVEGQWL